MPAPCPFRRALSARVLAASLAFAGLAAGLTGCGVAPAAPGLAAPPAASDTQPPGTGTSGRDTAGKPVRWEEVPEPQWPQAVHRFAELHRKAGGTLVYTEGNFTYLAVLAGEQPSGGYAVEIQWVTAYRDRLEVVYTLRGPGPGQAVTAVLTYPTKVIRIPRTTLPAQFLEAITDPPGPRSD